MKDKTLFEYTQTVANRDRWTMGIQTDYESNNKELSLNDVLQGQVGNNMRPMKTLPYPYNKETADFLIHMYSANESLRQQTKQAYENAAIKDKDVVKEIHRDLKEMQKLMHEIATKIDSLSF